MTFDLETWSMVPGPPSIRPPFESTGLDVIEEYSPQRVAATVLAVPGSELVHPAEPDWWSWVARWASNEEHVDLAMTLFDTTPRSWGGFTLRGRASAQALLTLHNAECELHTAESFGECMR